MRFLRYFSKITLLSACGRIPASLPSLPLELCSLATRGTQEGEGPGVGSVSYYCYGATGATVYVHVYVPSTLLVTALRVTV